MLLAVSLPCEDENSYYTRDPPHKTAIADCGNAGRIRGLKRRGSLVEECDRVGGDLVDFGTGQSA